MLLNAKMMKNVSNINHFEWTEAVNLQEGQINEFYFQIVDMDKKLDLCPMRYISTATTVSVDVTFPAVNVVEEIVVTATQPFPEDKSIWKVVLAPNQVPNSGAINIKLTEDVAEKFFSVRNAIQVYMLNRGGC